MIVTMYGYWTSYNATLIKKVQHSFTVYPFILVVLGYNFDPLHLILT